MANNAAQVATTPDKILQSLAPPYFLEDSENEMMGMWVPIRWVDGDSATDNVYDDVYLGADEPQFVLLDALSGPHASFFDRYAASRTDLYFSTDPSPILEFLRDEKTTSIDIEIYTMKDRDVRAAIRAALKRGVRVRIVKEPVPLGEGCQLFPKYIINRNSKDVMPVKDPADCADEQALVRDVEAAAAKGSAYVPFNKKEFCTKPYTYCFEHGKIAVVNDRVALVSTGNFDSTNLCNLKYNPDRCNRAYTVVTSVPEVVGTLGAVFKNDLKGKYYDLAELLKSVGSPKVTVSPFSLDQLIAFIDSAKESIRIQNQYLKEPEINKALIRAAGRKGPNGKKVRIMVNVASPCSFGKPQGHEATSFATIYRSFDAGGISSRMFTDLQKIGGMPGYLHAKAIVVDDKRAWVGSINGSTTAVNKNREFGVFFDDTVAVRKLIGQMQEDFTSPNSESWQEGLMCTKDTPRQ